MEWCFIRRRAIFIILIFLAVSRFFYLNYINWKSGELCTGTGGIQYGMDSSRYLDGSERIINHQELIEDEDKYTGYLLLITLVRTTGFGLSFLLIFQLIIALLAALALYDFGKSVTQSNAVGILAAGCYLINPFITQWHLFIHTESFYSSMLIISAWSLYKAVVSKNLKLYILSFILIIYTALIRPNGWVLIPIFICFVVIAQKNNRLIKSTIVVSVISSFFLVMIYVPFFSNKIKALEDYDLFSKGEIIFGRKESCLNMPKETYSDDNNSALGMKYILRHPAAAIKLSFARVATELLPLNRPWLTTKFIIRFLLWMVPAYVFFLIAAVRLRKNIGVLIIIFIVISHLGIIAWTRSDNDFRFLTYILPLIYLMGVFGFHEVSRNFLKNNLKIKLFSNSY